MTRKTDSDTAEEQTSESGWPESPDSELEYWNVMHVPPLDHWPEQITEDDGPFGVKNINDGKVVGIDYVTEDSTNPFPDDATKPFWVIQGPNSILQHAETLETAQRKLYNYANRVKSPSGMV